ncbi:MAG TPA: phosphoribosylformylglycinamidine synthase subunit PurS [Polyangiaceae bacterium]|nr:phosphoribosylformylglycinamidine synthase subunit PurS [Polyangiaceae bacterium]
MKATVYVRLKGEVLDPQGRAVQRALGALGVEGVRDVRIGKLIELDLDEAVVGEGVADKLRKISDELLANPVIEDYEVVVG